ncbi:hypothetical protein [Yersinia massiliensis]|nr:hypothetical protein [Yersinia massiliensis]MCB5307430.1 hypothetical protein [Yersinia massiliensis]
MAPDHPGWMVISMTESGVCIRVTGAAQTPAVALSVDIQTALIVPELCR